MWIYFNLIQFQYKITQYKTLNVQLSNSQLNKLEFGIKNGTEVTSKISANVVSDSNNEKNFPLKLLLNNTQVWRLRKGFVNNSSTNISLSEAQLHKIGQLGKFLGILLGPLLKTGLSLMENVLKLLAISALMTLGLRAPASATNAAVHKEMFESGTMTLIISNEDMNDVMKIVKSLEESGLLLKCVSETN